MKRFLPRACKKASDTLQEKMTIRSLVENFVHIGKNSDDDIQCLEVNGYSIAMQIVTESEAMESTDQTCFGALLERIGVVKIQR